MASDLLTGCKLAVSTTTIIPVGEFGEINRPIARNAMLFTPIAVLPVAAMSVALGWVGAWWGLPSIAAGAVVVAALAYGSRAMHLDALADTVDGLGGGWTPERALDIMKRGDVGPMGLAAVVVSLIIQASILGALVVSTRGAIIAGVAICASRGATALACARAFPAARKTGLGALVAASITNTVAALHAAVMAVVLGGVYLALSDGGRAWVGFAAALVGSLAALVLLVRARSKVSGVTGDIMGATIEVSLTASLIVLAGGTL